ncbi:MAG: CHAT domain-containing protein, partial [Pseudomonadota bacterium]
ERALPLRQEAQDGRGQVAVLRALADIDLREDRVEEAGESLNQAVRLASSPLAIAGIKVRQAEIWLTGDEHSRAEAVLSEARELAEDIGALAVHADAVFMTGWLYEKASRFEDSSRWFNEALAEYERLGIRSGKAKSLFGLARSRRNTDLELAIDIAKLAIAEVEALRRGVGDPELRAIFLASRAEYYGFLIDALMDAASRTTSADAATYILTALEVSERARARSTADLLNEAAVDLGASIDPDIRSQQITLTERLAEKHYQRSQMLETGADGDSVAAIVAEIGEIRAEIDVLESGSRLKNPVQEAMIQPQVMTAAQVQSAIGPDVVLLQYWLGNSQSYLWAVTEEALHGFKLPGRRQIEADARKAYDRLSRGGAAEFEDLLSELSKTLIQPAEEQIAGAKTVVVAADGALQYLPFAAFTISAGVRLIDTHRVVSVPSMTVIETLNRGPGNRHVPTRTLAAIGDPVFSIEDPRYQHLENDDVPAGGASAASGFDRLPFSGLEVEQIAGLVPEASRLIATGLDANVAAISGARLMDYRYVHFATHGVIDTTEPALSSLILSQWDGAGEASEPFLRLADIFALDLNAEVVVLSACDTALGRDIRGEGLIGLTQGFFYAGTEAVVASLWKVSDRATSELMAQFYANMLTEGQAPAEALRNAQASMARNRRWRNPYFWSGFVYQGGWSD